MDCFAVVVVLVVAEVAGGCGDFVVFPSLSLIAFSPGEVVDALDCAVTTAVDLETG